MEKMKPRTLSGFMELLPAPQQQMERIMEVLRRTYALYGFTPLDTPLIEASEVLLAKGGGETEKQIYRFTKGDADLSLRFDLTVPLAKYVALHYNELSFPFRRYQIGKVYRGERAQLGEQAGRHAADKQARKGADLPVLAADPAKDEFLVPQPLHVGQLQEADHHPQHAQAADGDHVVIQVVIQPLQSSMHLIFLLFCSGSRGVTR